MNMQWQDLETRSITKNNQSKTPLLPHCRLLCRISGMAAEILYSRLSCYIRPVSVHLLHLFMMHSFLFSSLIHRTFLLAVGIRDVEDC